MNCCNMDEHDQDHHVEIMIVCDGCENRYCSNCTDFADCDNEYDYIEGEDGYLHLDECDQCI